MEGVNTMSRDSKTGKILLVIAIIFSGLLAFTMVRFSQAYGEKAVPESERITLSAHNASGTWQTDDVIVEYQSEQTGGQIEISGQVNFTDQVSDTFNTVDYFKLIAAFLDDQGKELASYELMTKSNFSSRGAGPGFSKTVGVPQGASSFAFGYSGQAHSASTGDAEPFTKSFSHKPAR